MNIKEYIKYVYFIVYIGYYKSSGRVHLLGDLI